MRRSIRRTAALGFLSILFLAAPTSRAEMSPAFEATEVWAHGVPIHGLDTGDLLPERPGLEVAVLDASGAVFLLTPDAAPWTAELIVDDDDPSPGMPLRPTVAVGELMAEWPGEEVAVLSRLRLNVARSPLGGPWFHTTIHSSEGLMGHAWGARAGDYLPSRPGEELFMIYEGVLDFSHGRVCYRTDGAWALDIVYHAEVGMDSGAGEFDPAHEGAEAVVTTEMGPTYQIAETGAPPYDIWPSYMVWLDYEHAGWACLVADVDPLHEGNEVVYGTRYSNSILVSRPGDYGHDVELVFTGENTEHPRNMWDVDAGDVLPGAGALEIAGVDDTGRVYLAWRGAAGWRGGTVWRDPAGPLHAVVVGEFDAEAPGEEILVAGQAGTLTLLSHGDLTTAPGTESSGAGPSLICHPNPANPGVTLRYALPAAAAVTLSVHDAAGRLVRRLRGDVVEAAGAHAARWDGRDGRGRTVASGVYICRLEASGATVARRLVLLR